VGSAGEGFAGACRAASPSCKKRAGELGARFGNSAILDQTVPKRAPPHSPRRGERGEGFAGVGRCAPASCKNGSARTGPVSGTRSNRPGQAPRGLPSTPHAVGSAGGGFAGPCRSASPSSKKRVDKRVPRFGNSAKLTQTSPPRAAQHSPRRGERGGRVRGCLPVRISQFQKTGQRGRGPVWELGPTGPNGPPAGSRALPTPWGVRGRAHGCPTGPRLPVAKIGSTSA